MSRDIFLSSCKIFRAVNVSSDPKRIEYKVTRRVNEEMVGFIRAYEVPDRATRFVFESGLCETFTATDLLDLAGLVALVKAACEPDDEDNE
jgi:hypothetical protein